MEEIYTYLGYAIIAVLIYLIFKTIFVKKQPEGFFGMSDKKDDDTTDDDADNDDDIIDDDPKVAKAGKSLEALVTKVEKKTNGIIKAGYLVKNRKLWENLIIAMEDNINASSIQQLAIIGNGGQSVLKTIESLNALNKYKQTLKENMTYLDGLA